METAHTSGLEPLAAAARHIETEVDPDAQRLSAL